MQINDYLNNDKIKSYTIAARWVNITHDDQIVVSARLAISKPSHKNKPRHIVHNKY